MDFNNIDITDFKDEEALRAWSIDVIKWTNDELDNGNIEAVMNKLDSIITALVALTIPEYRKDVIRLIKTVIRVIKNARG